MDEKLEESPGFLRCSLLYDIARAQKLVPVDRRDWGYRAFRLLGESRKTKFSCIPRDLWHSLSGVSLAAYSSRSGQADTSFVRKGTRLLHLPLPMTDG